MTDDTGLLKVRGYAPAALVVEFNLRFWLETRHIKRGFTLFDQYDDETEAEYHERLSCDCEPIGKWARWFAAWNESALTWSDHYRRLRA